MISLSKFLIWHIGLIFVEKNQVKCNQSGKLFKVKIAALSNPDLEPITTMAELEKGTQLLLEFNKKSYPVTVLKTIEDRTGREQIIYITNQILT